MTKHEPIQTEAREQLEFESPFAKIYMDILGPFNEEYHVQSMFVITMIDHYSRFALTKTTYYCPTGQEAANLLRASIGFFHTAPDAVQTDGGSHFTGSDFCRAANELNCQRIVSPVGCSWTNGRVERFHRFINERIRAEFKEEVTTDFKLFRQTIKKITMYYNTSFSYALARSPHEAIFTFSPFIHPHLKSYRKEKANTETTDPTSNPNKRKISQRPMPKQGETWLLKKRKPKKAELRYQTCKIVEQVSPQTYKVMLQNHSISYQHIRNLKELTQDARDKLPQELQIPSERPVRNLRGGGMLKTS